MTQKEKYLSNILQQLEAFLKGSVSNRWIENAGIKVYLRKSERTSFILARHPVTFLDVANIAVAAKHRQKGLFTDFMDGAHEIHPFDLTYLECIRNPLILQWCIKRGWTPYNPWGREKVDCFYLPKRASYKKQTCFSREEVALLSRGIEELARLKKTRSNVFSAWELDDFLKEECLESIFQKLQSLGLRTGHLRTEIILQEISQTGVQGEPDPLSTMEPCVSHC